MRCRYAVQFPVCFRFFRGSSGRAHRHAAHRGLLCNVFVTSRLVNTAKIALYQQPVTAKAARHAAGNHSGVRVGVRNEDLVGGHATAERTFSF